MGGSKSTCQFLELFEGCYIYSYIQNSVRSTRRPHKQSSDQSLGRIFKHFDFVRSFSSVLFRGKYRLEWGPLTVMKTAFQNLPRYRTRSSVKVSWITGDSLRRSILGRFRLGFCCHPWLTKILTCFVLQRIYFNSFRPDLYNVSKPKSSVQWVGASDQFSPLDTE